MRRPHLSILLVLAMLGLSGSFGCASSAEPNSIDEAAESSASSAEKALAAARATIRRGNGEANWIKTDGVTRDGDTFTFSEVKIEENGWLVLHPFKDGKPVGKIYVGAQYVPAGLHRNVSISVDTAPVPEPGQMFIVMLHSDVNNDRTFDFYFVDELNVADKAVFEGNTIIAHAIKAP